MNPNEDILEVLAAHQQGRWSDWTYSCLGCARAVERKWEFHFETLGTQPSPEEMREFRREYGEATKPNWTIEQYNAHLADELRYVLADVWNDGAVETAEWMANNPSPAGIPHDPPSNPYE